MAVAEITTIMLIRFQTASQFCLRGRLKPIHRILFCMVFYKLMHTLHPIFLTAVSLLRLKAPAKLGMQIAPCSKQITLRLKRLHFQLQSFILLLQINQLVIQPCAHAAAA